MVVGNSRYLDAYAPVCEYLLAYIHTSIPDPCPAYYIRQSCLIWRPDVIYAVKHDVPITIM